MVMGNLKAMGLSVASALIFGLAVLNANAAERKPGDYLAFFYNTINPDQAPYSWDYINYNVYVENPKENDNIDFRFNTLVRYYALISNTPFTIAKKEADTNFNVYYLDDVPTALEAFTKISELFPERILTSVGGIDTKLGCSVFQESNDEDRKLINVNVVFDRNLNEYDMRACAESLPATVFGLAMPGQFSIIEPEIISEKKKKVYFDAYDYAPTLLWAIGMCREFHIDQSVKCIRPYTKILDDLSSDVPDGVLQGHYVLVDE